MNRLIWLLCFAPGAALALAEQAVTGRAHVLAMARAGERRPVLFLYSVAVYALAAWLVYFTGVLPAGRMGLLAPG
jgi:hypothetical protein